MEQDDRVARREARRRRVTRVHRLGEEPSDDLRDTTTAQERWDMMAELARDAWAAAGRPLPEYAREDMPCTVRRLEDV